MDRSTSEPMQFAESLVVAGRWPEAEQAYRSILASAPGEHEAAFQLGNLLARQNRMADAEAAYRRALEICPDLADAANNLGNALQAQRRVDEAEAAFRRALTICPTHADALTNLGMICHARNDLCEAECWFRKALSIVPHHADAIHNLGVVLTARHRQTEAEAMYRYLLGRHPQRADTAANLGATLLGMGRAEEAMAVYQQAFQARPDDPDILSRLLCCMQYQQGIGLADLAAAHAQWQQRHAAGLRSQWRDWDLPADPERPLRVGFVSADLEQHPVGCYLAPLLEKLDARQFALFGYADSPADDAMTGRIRAACHAWRNVWQVPDADLAEMIRGDGIDILFDLGGHSGGLRLLCFARKPAPIQIGYLGYESTTGLEAMDYVLSDARQIPPGSEAHYREQVLRVPGIYVCYEPPSDAPEVSPPPCGQDGPVTFGCLCNPCKINARVAFTWAEILRRLPDSRLVLQFKAFADGGAKQRFWQLFAVQGIETSRIDILGPMEYCQRLGVYHRIDVALDPFPYGGAYSSCEALWMGVPVVTLPREVTASRDTYNFLAQLDLADLAAADPSHYVEVAVALAADRARLASIRGDLRRRMLQSPLCDAARLAADVGRLLREAWRRWCGGRTPASASSSLREDRV